MASLREVSADLAAEEKMMADFTTWCDAEANEKEDAITSAKRTIGDLNAVITDSNARIGELHYSPPPLYRDAIFRDAILIDTLYLGTRYRDARFRDAI